MPEKEEEYEMIPLSPIRRLEKRISQLESGPGAGVDVKGFFHELVEIVRMNQQLVDELVKANDSLRIELSRIPGRLEEVTKNLNELISYIKAAAREEAAPNSPETMKSVTDKMDKLFELNKKIIENNEALTSIVETIDKKLRPMGMPIRKPVFAPRPV
jgi:predicted nuclease with TOPRIM domain